MILTCFSALRLVIWSALTCTAAYSDVYSLCLGMALLGCDVVTTDQKEVLPLLRRNVERNTSMILQSNPGSCFNIFSEISLYFAVFVCFCVILINLTPRHCIEDTVLSR